MSKILLVVLSLPLLAASCGLPFGGSGNQGGVYKTFNAGADWLSANKVAVESQTGRGGKIETSFNESLSESDVFELAFSKSGINRLFSASGKRGLYASEDEGETWKNILNGFTAYSVEPDIRVGSKIFVGGSSSGVATILMTEDLGASWQAVFSDSSSGEWVRSLDMDQTGQNIAAGLSSGDVILSADGGVSWKLGFSLTGEISQVRWQGSGLYVLGGSKGLFFAPRASSLELTDLTANLLDVQFNGIDSNFSRPNNFWRVEVAPWSFTTLFLATDAGLFVSRDSGLNWSFSPLPVRTDSNESEVTALSVGVNEGDLMAGIGSNVYITLNNGASWQVRSVALGGKIRYILRDTSQSRVVYAGVERTR